MAATEAGNPDTVPDVNITEIADLLAQQFIIITGGKSKEGYPIITFPDNGMFHMLCDSDYKKLLLYITSIPSMQEQDSGFVLVIDRRNDRWSSVKHILFKFTEFFPGLIHVVYVIRPSGFFQKAISEVSNKFFKEDFKFKVVICNEIDELQQYLDKSELTIDLNGDLPYSNQDWIQQRISLEHFSTQMKLVSCSLDEFTRNIQDISCELPNTVEDTIQLLNEHSIQYGSLKQSISDSCKRGEMLLSDMKSGTSRIPSVINISAVERLLVQLEETEVTFDKFWNQHATRLRQCLELRNFEQDFRIVQVKLDDYLRAANEMNEIGDSVEHVDSLIEELNNFHAACQSEIDNSEGLMRRGAALLNSNHRYMSLEGVEPKCDELRRINQSLAEKLLRRIETLKKAKELQIRIKKANSWCTRGIELLGSQNIEKCSMFPEHVEQVLSELEQFVASADDFNVSGSEDLYVLFQDSITPETRPLVTQVLQRIEDVMVMCDKKITNLRRLMAKPNRPVQPVSPEPAIPLSQSPTSSETTNHNGELQNGIVSELQNGDVTIINNHHNGTNNCCLQTKRDHILNELLETERVYVSEIKSIITGYKNMMEDEQLQKIVPAEFHSKEDILFCNLDDLYDFHGEIFLPKLESFISDLEQVACLFQDQKDRFVRLYSFYCQNLLKSEKLREKVGERNAFFLACQIKLGHKLPLAAYMLKPVQRITKYQLLLKDLINNIDDEKCSTKLQQALDCMLLVLKCVNDRMHQISITGFKYDIADQGDLLLQGSFSMWIENKKDLLKELRLKPMRRHVFLYKKAIIFCKKMPSYAKGEYQFKGMLKMSKIGLTETVKGDARKFEVWLEGRQEVYTIQASTVEQKELWVKEIKQVLFDQLTELKGEKIRQYAEKFAPYKTISLDGVISQSHSPCSSRSNSRPNSHHEITDDSSSDLSNSDDEEPFAIQPLSSGKYVALADYCASGHNEVSMKEGDPLELLKIGSSGWWYIKLLSMCLCGTCNFKLEKRKYNTMKLIHQTAEFSPTTKDCSSEGWVPASYLEQKDNRKSSRGSASVSSQRSVCSQQSVSSQTSTVVE